MMMLMVMMMLMTMLMMMANKVIQDHPALTLASKQHQARNQERD